MIRVGLTGIGKPKQLTITSNQPFGIKDVIDSTQSVTLSLDDGEISISSDMGQIGRIGPTFAKETSPRLRLPRATEGKPIRLIPLKDDTVFEIVSPKVRYPRYRGILEINGGKALSIVNELPLEEYVKAVIPLEVPAAFQPEARKALAIAIRTYALKSLDRHKSSGFNVCDGIHCQGFTGASKEAEWVDRLVDETRGQILVYKGEPIFAVYSSDCGGMTQNNEDAGYGQALPYLRSVSDRKVQGSRFNVQGSDAEAEDYCTDNPFHIWNKRFTSDRLGKAFSRLATGVGKFQSMEFAEYDCSRRVKTILIKGDQGEHRMTGSRFRELFGESVIKSARMTLTISLEGDYVIEGKGFGHGVGLCAFGANGMAKSGSTCEEILKHYYSGAEIKTH